jgi:hypothetical protein
VCQRERWRAFRLVGLYFWCPTRQCSRASPILFCRFLATGDSYRPIAFNYRLGHSTVQTIVQDVCIAIIANLKAESLPTPTKEKWKEIANEFWNLWNFPHCLGALDGKHIKIVAPANSGSNYFN